MNLQPERAWQMVLDQLQMDMSVASFNTWVKDTEFISYENDILIIGTANAYASEWLTSRLTSTVSRVLAGILAQPVSVQFVVHEPSSVYEDDVEGEIEDEILDKGKPLEELTLQAEYQSIYDEIVQP
jgi:chromosomal replication initiation ATPase DnaA